MTGPGNTGETGVNVSTDIIKKYKFAKIQCKYIFNDLIFGTYQHDGTVRKGFWV